MNLAQALRAAQQDGLARLDAQLLLAHLLQRPRSWLLAHDDAELDAGQCERWRALAARRSTGEPLAYIVGEREFHGLALNVSPAVLVPRPETEVLVDWALECLHAAPESTVVDLGTGSGAVALAIKRARPTTQVTATDASAPALAVARDNALRHGLDIGLALGDWWYAVPGLRFGLAVSNPPYIAAGDPHLPALRHEPLAALSPGGDGLDAIRQLVQDAPAHLLPGAWLLLEHGHDQERAVKTLLLTRGFVEPVTRADLAGLPRCTGALWPGSRGVTAD